MKTNYRTVKELREASGFGWNDAEGRVTATNAVWDDYIDVCFFCLFYSI